ncbi:protein RKD1 [Artemisia annua]|uniref:Protein RKD1 n=1 Tax=Artemisia annua TaxID=35608 RepID=A0A2U1MH37_ARTAN|nr:protein RKD1 [Artemisia annua]
MALTREVIAQYFYMPISQAAKKLNVGLIVFKKQCQELGIHRWPHRKLMSIQSLINNVQIMKRWKMVTVVIMMSKSS